MQAVLADVGVAMKALMLGASDERKVVDVHARLVLTKVMQL